MSTPPPPPPPSAPPPPFAGPTQPAWDRRTLRDQRRAAALAARQQRDLQRLQARAMRRQSLLGPLMLVALGVLFLMIELGTVHASTVLAWLAHWWPTLLLAAGLVLLLEWATDTWVAGRGGTALPRRTLGPGGTFLLVLVSIAGISAMALQHGSDWIRRNFDKDVPQSWNLEPLFGQHREVDRDLNAPLTPGTVLTVANSHGTINVTGDSPDAQVHVSVHQRFVAWRSDDLRRREQRNEPSLEQHAGGLTLSVPAEGDDSADLTIQLPHEAGLTLGAGKGDVNVSQLRGPVHIQEHSGDIVLTGLTGHVQITAHDDSASITGHSLSGDVLVTGRSGDLTFSDITGPTTLHGDFFGTTHLERIAGPVTFQSSFTTFKCAGVAGELNIEGRSELEAENLAGPVLLSTSDRNITLSGVRNGATVTNRNGSVTMTLKGPLSPTQVTTSDGSIEVYVPEKTGLTLSAITADGQINNNLGLNPTENGGRKTLSGQVLQGGPTIKLETANGDITVENKSKDDDDNSSPAKDDSAAHHRSRHLHVD